MEKLNPSSLVESIGSRVLDRCRGINEHGGYFGVSARDCKIRGSKSSAGSESVHLIALNRMAGVDMRQRITRVLSFVHTRR